MPPKCRDSEDRPVFALDLSSEEFDELRRAHRELGKLHFACCDSKLGLRTSSKGLRHFYHLTPGSNCQEVPAFQIRFDEEGRQGVRITPTTDLWKVSLKATREQWAPLETFVMAALSKNLAWPPVSELGKVDIILRSVNQYRCDCGQQLMIPTSLQVDMQYRRHRPLLTSPS